ncbi:MAG: alcohol dehydrogenase catalytic domain-containing protein [Desulfobacterales bacterium]|nr:MAG: alcohol dehydrogenase catalytic domain-containing protein [Desulfobacterales bacterium]
MKAAQISEAGGEFEIVEREIPTPGPNQVRVKVEACGICHSDAFVKEGLFPGIAYPRVPGHEVAGIIDEVGSGVSHWEKGQRVGVGWHGGHCFKCASCRAGDYILCENAKICGITYDGGYQEYMVAEQEALARIPDDLKSAEAAPLLCAGITTYNSLRNSGARGGDVVAVHGIGGLGHLAVQFARKLGYQTVALSRGKDKEPLAVELGAHHYIDTTSENAVEALQKLGGARVILSTAPDSKSISGLIDGLGANGKLLIVAAAVEPIEVSPLQLIRGRRSITGWPSGHAKDSEAALNFSALTGVLPMIETYPLEHVADAYGKMINNRARFRVVLTMTA